MVFKETEAKTLKYIVTVVLVILVCIALFGQFVNGKMLPEPSMKIYVEGMDTIDYWLDLLVKDSEINYKRAVSVRIGRAVEKLSEYSDDEGFHPAMLVGNDGEFVGGFDGFLRSDGSIRHEFWGEGLPKEFKIIIQTRDGRLIVSDLVKVTVYHSEVRFSFDELDETVEISTNVGEIKETFPWNRMFLSFFARLLAAFLIKLSITEIFGFKSSKASGIVIKTILTTQIILNLLLISQIFFGAKVALIVFAVASLLILIAECVIYASLIKDKKMSSKIAVAIISNLASALAGYFLIYFIEWVSF